MKKFITDMLTGEDGKWSIRRVLAMIFAAVVAGGTFITGVDSDKLLISAGLVASLLALTTYQNVQQGDNTTQLVENAQNIESENTK